MPNIALGNFELIEVVQDGAVTEVWLNRPQVNNAFNPRLISELTICFNLLAQDQPRAVLLGGTGKYFCAGADLEWMHSMVAFNEAENLADALRLADMLQSINTCPCPVVARVQGGAFGGGVGLLACCDTVIAANDSVYALSEVRFGLSPATITPYVVAKIGYSAARDLMLSGERFGADQALALDLVNFLVTPRELDDAVDAKISEILKAGPRAAIATKALLRDLSSGTIQDTRTYTAQLIAELRVSTEGQEGVSAFLAKRSPGWDVGK